MGKKNSMNELVRLLTLSLRHRVGSIVNENEHYATKYAKDAEVFLTAAKRVLESYNWSRDDKENIRSRLRDSLYKELHERHFLNEKKFKIMDREIKGVLKEVGLV